MTRHHAFSSAAFLIVALFTSACGDKNDYSTSTAEAREKDFTYEQREDYRRDMEVAVQKLDAKLAELRAKAASGADKVEDGTKSLIADAEKAIADLRHELDGIGSSTKEGWNDFKRKFRESMDDLGRRIEDALD